MTRRELLGLLTTAAAAWPHQSWAQSKQWRIGVILGFPEHDHQTSLCIQSLLMGLKNVGLEDRRNVQIDYRWPGIDGFLFVS